MPVMRPAEPCSDCRACTACYACPVKEISQKPLRSVYGFSAGAPMKATESVEQFFASSGVMPTVFNEQRRFPRFYLRCCADATIYPLGGSAEPTRCVVVMRDVSRGGMGLLHTEQLFPGQRIDLVLNADVVKSLEVVWCRRVADKSYSVGCRFKETEPAEPN